MTASRSRSAVPVPWPPRAWRRRAGSRGRSLAPLVLLVNATPAAAADLGSLFSTDFFTSTADRFGDAVERLLPGVSQLRLGVGPVIAPYYEGDDDYDLDPGPMVSLRYRDWLEVDNNNVRVNLFGGRRGGPPRFRAGPTLRVDFGREQKDSADLAGLGSVDTSIEVGGFVSYDAEPWRYRVRLRRDITGGHHGWIANADWSLAMKATARTRVAAQLTVSWVNRRYMNSYFGVDAAAAAASGLPEHVADAGFKDVTLSFASETRLSERWALVLNAGYERLLGEAKNNPLVRLRGSPDQFIVGAFAVYSFD